MAEQAEKAFHCEVEESQDEKQHSVTKVICHGRLVSENVETLKKTVKPLIERGTGNIVIDCKEVTFLDSLGLGGLVGLKVSALHKPHCSVKLVNVSSRVKELLRLTQLDEFLSY